MQLSCSACTDSMSMCPPPLLGRSPGDVSALLSRVQYSGLTPLAVSLRDKVLGPIVFSLAGSGQLAKPVLVITITDGEPTDNPKDLVAQVSQLPSLDTPSKRGSYCIAKVGQLAAKVSSRLSIPCLIGNIRRGTAQVDPALCVRWRRHWTRVEGERR